MKRTRRHISVSLAVVLLLSAGFLWYFSANNRADSPRPTEDGMEQGLRIHFSTHDFSNVRSIRLRNMHNGTDTYITEEADVQAICVFLKTVKGSQGGSSRGYYEGVYTLSLYANTSAAQAVLDEEVPLFSIGFGDSASFNHGEFEDGYPIRYLLDNMTQEEVTQFLCGYEKKPFE